MAILGCDHARVYVGDRHDRFRNDVSWAQQVQATVDVLRQLTPQLKDLGIRVAIETHADLTVDELMSALALIDPEIAGVTLDTGNLVMRLDDPVEATRSLAPWVVATHIKDAALAFTPRGFAWQARPVGSGILPLPDMLAILFAANPAIALSIELHPRTYDLPVFDRKWLSYFPDLRPESLAAVVRLAAQCESRYAEGSLARPEVVEAIPWADRDLDWLASSLGYLRSVVPHDRAHLITEPKDECRPKARVAGSSRSTSFAAIPWRACYWSISWAASRSFLRSLSTITRIAATPTRSCRSSSSRWVSPIA